MVSQQEGVATMSKVDTEKLIQQQAASIKSRRFIKTIRNSGAMFVYDEKEGIYVPQAEETIAQEIEATLVEKSSDYVVKEVIHKIQRSTYVSVDDFDSNERLVHVGNGILDLDTLTLEPHNRQYLSLRKVAANYDPDADCPVFKKFLEDTLEPTDRLLSRQFLGFLLTNGYRYRHAFTFVGPTHTGKTTLANALTAFLGKENTTSISLQSLCDIGSYDTHDLLNSMANIHDDLEAEDVKRFGRLKQLTGDSRIRAREIYGKPFDFWNKSKLAYFCNKIPPAGKADDAYYGRWIIIPMMKQFVEGVNADDRMKEKLESPLELSGMLNLAIMGLMSLEANRGFCYPTDPRAHRCRYLAYSGDVVARFVSECFVYENEITPKQTIFEYYGRYCERIGTAPLDEISFFMRLSDYIDDRIMECRPTEVNRMRAYRGLKVVLPKRIQPAERFHFTGVSLRPSDFGDD